MEYNPLAAVGTTAPTIEPNRPSEADLAKVRTLAQQFEAMLLTQMLRDMKESMTPEADRGGLGGPILGDTVNTELGLSLSQSGGVGLADVLMKAMKAYEAPRRETDLDMAAPALATMAPAPEPGRDTVLAMPVSAGVTSDYGWRTDPIHGQARFHAGVDLRSAYGQDVHAAAAGVVTFAGTKGGYGTTVVLQHDDGLETRYAHLSSADVQEGTRVAAGAVIARSGNSGRSTGPHLHFEVRQDGRAVNPQALTGTDGGAVSAERN